MSIITYDKIFPTHCEFCGSKLVVDSVNLVCANTNCIQKTEASLKAWCINLAPIDGLGWTTIIKILKKYDIQTVLQLIQMPYIEDNSTAENSEAKLFNKMLNTLKTGKYTVSQFLLALNVPGLGSKGALAIEKSKHVKDIIEYITGSMTEFGHEMSILAELGSLIQDNTTASSLIKYPLSGKVKKYYNYIKDRLIITDSKDVITKGKVVITGSLEIPRKHYEQILLSKGWQLMSSVTKETNYLITNTPNSDTAKNKKATELNVPKISSKDFLLNVLQVTDVTMV